MRDFRSLSVEGMNIFMFLKVDLRLFCAGMFP
jgi:hypothetical protein